MSCTRWSYSNVEKNYAILKYDSSRSHAKAWTQAHAMSGKCGNENVVRHVTGYYSHKSIWKQKPTGYQRSEHMMHRAHHAVYYRILFLAYVAVSLALPYHFHPLCRSSFFSPPALSLLYLSLSFSFTTHFRESLACITTTFRNLFSHLFQATLHFNYVVIASRKWFSKRKLMALNWINALIFCVAKLEKMCSRNSNRGHINKWHISHSAWIRH